MTPPPPTIPKPPCRQQELQARLPLHDNCLMQTMPEDVRQKCLALFTEMLRTVVLGSNPQTPNADER